MNVVVQRSDRFADRFAQRTAVFSCAGKSNRRIHALSLDRPLTVLSVDINNFSEFNDKFGHATGDRILAFTGQIIKNQLRQMDFLARSASDEFTAVLPTASKEIAFEIIGRIERAFVTRPFETIEGEKVYLKLNFGAATFGRDGEGERRYAEHLLKTAITEKQQGKSTVRASFVVSQGICQLMLGARYASPHYRRRR